VPNYYLTGCGPLRIPVEDIIAMKMDVIQRAGRKKDFWEKKDTLTAMMKILL
jgi:hypothetical protein